MAPKEIKSGVYWVGARDWNRKIFDALIPLPLGTSYNSYLVKGGLKTALIDSVNPGFENELISNIREITDPGRIDYLIMNHAEPDHAGAIPAVLEVSPSAVVLTTKKGAEMARIMHHVPETKIKTVADGDSVELGDKTLRFIEAPFLHWPETMFTYAVEDKVLFPCDFFGLHTANALYDYESEELIAMAKTYFGEIMMPFRKMGARAMDKIEGLDIDAIAPSHGPVHTDPAKILDAYRKWTSGATREKVIAVYVSMWKSTETMVSAMVNSLLSEGIEVAAYNLAETALGEIAKDLVDSGAIVFGTPTVLGGMHPVAAFGASLVKALKPPLRYGVVLSSYGWSGGAVKAAQEVLGPTKIELVGVHDVKGPPSDEDISAIVETGKRLAAKLKEG